MKTAAADSTCAGSTGRDLVGRDGDEVVEELEHAPRLVVLRNRVGDLAEDLLGEGPQHRNLVEQRRVEHDVGVLLVGEDLASPGALSPSAKASRARRRRAGGSRAIRRRKEAVVGGGDAREVVHRHRREARDVDAEPARRGSRA